MSELTNRLAEVAGRLGEQQAKNRALSGEASLLTSSILHFFGLLWVQMFEFLQPNILMFHPCCDQE